MKNFPKLYKTIFQARYKPNLKFYELLYKAAQKFEDYPHWQTDKLAVTLRNFDKYCSLGIHHNSFSYDQDSDSISDEKHNLDKAVLELPINLDIKDFIRIGYRQKYLIEVDMSFQELVDILHLKYFSQNVELLKIIPAKSIDLQYVLDSTEDDLNFHIRIGPVRKDEIERHVEFNKQNHLDPAKAQEEYKRIVKLYPAVSIYFDIDIFKMDKKISIESGIPFIEDSRNRIKVMLDKFRKYIFSL